MKVSINWLKELVDLKVPIEDLVRLLPLRTIGLKEITNNYIELDMKGYNRADLLSLHGIANELTAITGSKLAFKEPEEADFVWNQQQLPNITAEIKDEKLCSLQCVAKIEGLKVNPSKDEWVKKLAESGMRSVNNIVDVTNLVMLEYGQPLHSFDASTIKDETITVRLANEGEEITTLDNKLRKLDPTDIVLADTEKPIDVAGVMGGKETETSDSTSTILLTASLFNAQMIMKTTHKLGLYSEASKRFQHGLTKKRLLQGFNAAIKMYETLGGKLTAITLVGNLEDETRTIKLSQEKVNSLIGIEISPEQIEDSLQKLGFTLASHIGSGNVFWEVTVPYFRLDVNIEEDLIEEIARMYGYEKIPPKELVGEVQGKTDQTLPRFIYDLKKILAETGLTEVQTYSFYSAKIVSSFKLQVSSLIKIANPISAETEYLRDNLWPNLLEVAARNVKQGYKDIAVFEIGKVYSPVTGDLPKETYHLAIALCNGTNNPIQELNQILQTTCSRHPGLSRIDSGVADAPQNDKYFHPIRFSALEKDGKAVGYIAEIHPRFVNKFGIEQRIAVLEINLSD